MEINVQEIEERAFDRSLTPELSDVEMSYDELVYALQHDNEFFIQFFLGEEITVPVPDFHVDNFQLMTHTAVDKVAVALPRGHAKTTVAKLAAVKLLLFTEWRFGLYVSNTLSVAAEACQDIINFLESDNGKILLGEISFLTEQRQKGFYKFRMKMPGRKDAKGRDVYKICILKAMGAGQQIRGLNIDNERPEFVFADDVEDDENTATKAMRLKLKTWFYGPFMKAMARGPTKLVFIGNMISSEGLLYHVVEKSDFWYSRRLGCINKEGQPLWPEIWPLEALIADFREYKDLGLTGRWFAEMMNIPLPDSSPLIKADEITYRPRIDPSMSERSFITIDPAVSVETWADKTGIAAHAYADGIGWQVPHFVERKMEPEHLFFATVELCKLWGTNIVGIEAAGYQKALKVLFDIYSKIHDFPLRIVELPHKNRSKTERLAAWTALLRTGEYSLPDADLAITEQLLNYDPAKRENVDDLIDACSMGVPMIRYHMDLILNPNPVPTSASKDTRFGVTIEDN